MARTRVKISTADPYLYQKIRLELGEEYLVVESGEELLIADLDTVVCEGAGVTLGHGDGVDIPLPFRLGELKKRISRHTGRLVLAEGGVLLDGKQIRLTELEGRLLGAIYSRRGGYATREQLLSEVWGEGAEGGILNVYVHYLREKLERGGERVILSSRKEGYAINPIFTEGEDA